MSNAVVVFVPSDFVIVSCFWQFIDKLWQFSQVLPLLTSHILCSLWASEYLDHCWGDLFHASSQETVEHISEPSMKFRLDWQSLAVKFFWRFQQQHREKNRMCLDGNKHNYIRRICSNVGIILSWLYPNRIQQIWWKSVILSVKSQNCCLWYHLSHWRRQHRAQLPHVIFSQSREVSQAEIT